MADGGVEDAQLPPIDPDGAVLPFDAATLANADSAHADTGGTNMDASVESDAARSDSSTSKPDAAFVPDSGAPDSAVPWHPPAASQVHGTATSAQCLSSTPVQNGNCGGYYCGVNQSQLTPELDPAKPCGDSPAFMCKAELPKVVAGCANAAHSGRVVDLLGGDTSGFRSDIEQCVRANANVVANNIKESCQACFVEAVVCCAGKAVECDLPCQEAIGTKECDTAQRNAGCLDPMFVCGGLPNPF
jgi:hypothetical protein